MDATLRMQLDRACCSQAPMMSNGVMLLLWRLALGCRFKISAAIAERSAAACGHRRHCQNGAACSTLGRNEHVICETSRKTARKGHLNRGERIILKWVYKNYDMTMWVGFSCLIVGTSGKLFLTRQLNYGNYKRPICFAKNYQLNRKNYSPRT